MDVRIAPAGSGDLAALMAGVPAPPGTSARRFERHLSGSSTLLLAWDGDVVAGRTEVLWGGCAAPEVAAVLPDVPEVNGLDVAAAVRGRGIGTALLAAAAAAVRARRLSRVGLGVAPSNARALALYRRLGFEDVVPYVDRYTITAAGVEYHQADSCVFLVAAAEEVQRRAGGQSSSS